MINAYGVLAVALVAGLGSAACSRADEDGRGAAKTNVETPKVGLERRAEFLGVPGAVPGVVRQVAAEFPKHPPLARDTALLVAAARVGFSSQTFDTAIAATPASSVTPDAPTLSALKKFANAYARLQPMPMVGVRSEDGDIRLASLLPTIAAARERGLAFDRINLLAESTRNDPDVVNALAPSTLRSGGSELMTYSRDNVGHEDEAWGGNQHAQVAAAVARTSAALRGLEPVDVAAIEKWYEGAAGRAELAWTSAALTRAYDAAGAAMTEEYFRLIQADRNAHQP